MLLLARLANRRCPVENTEAFRAVNLKSARDLSQKCLSGQLTKCNTHVCARRNFIHRERHVILNPYVNVNFTCLCGIRKYYGYSRPRKFTWSIAFTVARGSELLQRLFFYDCITCCGKYLSKFFNGIRVANRVLRKFIFL